jgi:hypothetical protein
LQKKHKPIGLHDALPILIPLINGIEYSWGDITATVGGVPVVGITAIEYGDDQVVENHYGAGRFPVSYSKGRVTPSAKITVAMGEVIGWQAKSPTGRLQDLAPFPIVVAYIPEDGQIVTDKIMNCRFKKNARNWKEGDTRQLVDLELVPSHIKWHNK